MVMSLACSDVVLVRVLVLEMGALSVMGFCNMSGSRLTSSKAIRSVQSKVSA